jgi:hypothetical protein
MYDPPRISAAQRAASTTSATSEQAVAGIFDGTAMVLFDLRIEELPEMRP